MQWQAWGLGGYSLAPSLQLQGIQKTYCIDTKCTKTYFNPGILQFTKYYDLLKRPSNS